MHLATSAASPTTLLTPLSPTLTTKVFTGLSINLPWIYQSWEASQRGGAQPQGLCARPPRTSQTSGDPPPSCRSSPGSWPWAMSPAGALPAHPDHPPPRTTEQGLITTGGRTTYLPWTLPSGPEGGVGELGDKARAFGPRATLGHEQGRPDGSPMT